MSADPTRLNPQYPGFCDAVCVGKGTNLIYMLQKN